ncbi:MAG: hypothetical protein LBF01_00850 [Bacteroidales bacterium]|jgi:hypothetical protein|nr:hypothetical protein [Bacteroidales bacterium]
MKTLLKVLCILTFIYSGICFISYTVVAVPNEKWWSVFFEEMKNAEGVELLIEQNPQIEEAFATAEVLCNNDIYLTLMALLCFCSVAGAALMLKKRVIGFHVYTLAHLVMIALPLIMFRSMSFSISGAIFSIIIIGLYALAMFRKSAANNNDNEYMY